MTAPRRDHGSRARRRIDDALEILRQSLGNHLAPPRASAAPAALDLVGLLSLFIERLPESKLPRRARTLAHAARDARNEVAHFAGRMTPALALHHISAIRQLLVDLDDDTAVAEVNPIYRAQIAELAADRSVRTPAQDNGVPGEPAPSARRPARHASATPPGRASRSDSAPATTQAEDIRRFVRDYFIGPAARSNRTTATVRAGDVATLMDLPGRVPNIVSALGGRKFESLANVLNDGRSGPRVGADTVFTFTILDPPTIPGPDSPPPRRPLPQASNGAPGTSTPRQPASKPRRPPNRPPPARPPDASPAGTRTSRVPARPLPRTDAVVRPAKIGSSVTNAPPRHAAGRSRGSSPRSRASAPRSPSSACTAPCRRTAAATNR